MKWFTVLITVLFHTCCCLEQNYYWREYTGEVPEDAVVAGQSTDGRNIYIGQALLNKAGLIVVQIFPRVRQVYATFDGIKEIDKYIKILCGEQENFYWMPTNYTHYHLDVANKHAVIGGHQFDHGNIYIGRASYKGNTKIGKVDPYKIEDAFFYFNNDGSEKGVESYEVLMYKDKTVDADSDKRKYYHYNLLVGMKAFVKSEQA